MKKSNFLLYSLVLCTVLVTTSCEIFTNSLATSLARDESDLLSNYDAAEILSADNTDASAVLEALATKDAEEILKLDTDDKETILSTTLGESIDISGAKSLLESLIESDSESELDISTLLDDIFECIDEDTNTTAAVTLLTDAETLETADTGSITEASIAILAQSAETLNSANIDLVANFENSEIDITEATTEDIVETLIGTESTLSEEEMTTLETNLTAAINALKVVSGTTTTITNSDGVETEVTREVDEDVSILGLISLEDILDLIEN